MKMRIALLLAGNLLLACKKEDTATKVAAVVGQPFDLAEQQSTTLAPGSANALSVRLTQVLDSRCPIGTYCFLAGSVAVDVELTDATAAPQAARIYLSSHNALPNYSRDSVSVLLNQQKYWLRLLAVNPYPSTGSPPKVATLRLRPY